MAVIILGINYKDIRYNLEILYKTRAFNDNSNTNMYMYMYKTTFLVIGVHNKKHTHTYMYNDKL